MYQERKRGVEDEDEESPGGVVDLLQMQGLSVPTSQTLPARKKTRSRLSVGSKQSLAGLGSDMEEAQSFSCYLGDSVGMPSKKEKSDDGEKEEEQKENANNSNKLNDSVKVQYLLKKEKQAGKEAALSGIHRLPGSCIVHILKLASSDDEFRNDARLVFPLVCKRWYEILKAPSDVWEHVYVEQDAGLNRSIDVQLLREWLLHRSPAVRRVTFRYVLYLWLLVIMYNIDGFVQLNEWMIHDNNCADYQMKLL